MLVTEQFCCLVTGSQGQEKREEREVLLLPCGAREDAGAGVHLQRMCHQRGSKDGGGKGSHGSSSEGTLSLSLSLFSMV